MSDTTTTDATTSRSSVNGSSEPVSSLFDEIEHMHSLLSQDIPEDTADQDIAALLQHLDRIDSISDEVEGRIDAVLEKLDSILSTPQPDRGTQTVEAQVDSTTAEEPSQDLRQ
ncbi:hypothetical protein EI94DRAFT_1744058 [Lactarius quietus]|nr:hypothetical protein EI94DRAFT_1744058 [Lactarius quietus]